MALSDNGKEVLLEVIKWAGATVTVAGAVLTLWIQSHNQHEERIAELRENGKQLKEINVQLSKGRPLVFAGAKE